MRDSVATRRAPRRCLAAVGACGLLALAPGVAHADDTTYAVPASQDLSFGPVKVKGYTMSGYFQKAASGEAAGPRLYVSLTRTSGKTTQTVSVVAVRGVLLTVKPDLSATADAKLGSLGRIKLRFAPVGRTRTTKAPKGCTGQRISTRTGGTTGSFRLVVDHSFFRTIKGGKFKASASRAAAGTCKGGTGTSNPGDQQPSLFGGSGQLSVNVDHSSESRVMQSVSQTSGQDPSVQHSITVDDAPPPRSRWPTTPARRT